MAVQLGVEGPRPQRRLTVAFRVLLAIPHFLFGSAVLGTIALFVIIVAWFAALITARVPHAIADLLARILQYQARMYGYGQLLLTDRYPPFTVGLVDYPVELSFDEVGTFNRAAVLFRAILQLPALILTQLVSTGVAVCLFFIWLVTLVAGRMPDAAHMALASALRYQMRTYAYVGLVTTEYPHGLFGDREGEPTDGDELPGTPHITRFVLSRAAKNLLVLFLVLGVGLQSVNVAVSVGDVSRGLGTARELDEHYVAFLDSWEVWTERVDSCGESAECRRSANTGFGIAVDRLQQQVWALEVPDAAMDEVDVVSDDLTALRQLLVDTGDPVRLSLQVEDALFELDEDYQDLYDAVLAG